MPIPFLEIDAHVVSRLDAEGSDHYSPAKRVLAANAAMDFIVTGIGQVLGRRKFSDKLLSEVMFTRIWQTSSYGRVQMAEANLTAAGQGPIWDILAVHAEPETVPAAFTITPAAATVSILRNDLSLHRSAFECKRLTHEQYAQTERNPLLGGSEYLAQGELRSYYYMVHSYMRTLPDYPTTMWELQVGPQSLTGKVLVAITHLKAPVPMTDVAGVMPFPVMARELLISRTLHYLSIQQGDGTSLYNTQERDTQMLMNMLA